MRPSAGEVIGHIIRRRPVMPVRKPGAGKIVRHVVPWWPVIQIRQPGAGEVISHIVPWRPVMPVRKPVVGEVISHIVPWRSVIPVRKPGAGKVIRHVSTMFKSRTTKLRSNTGHIIRRVVSGERLSSSTMPLFPTMSRLLPYHRLHKLLLTYLL